MINLDLLRVKKALLFHGLCILIAYFAFVCGCNLPCWFENSKMLSLVYIFVTAIISIGVVVFIAWRSKSFQQIPLRYFLSVGIILYLSLFVVSNHLFSLALNNIWVHSEGTFKVPIYFIFIPDGGMAATMAVVGLSSCFILFISKNNLWLANKI